MDYERASVAHCETPKVAHSGDGAFDDLRSLVAAQHAAVLRPRFLAIRSVRCDQFDAVAGATCRCRNHGRQLIARVSVVVVPSDGVGSRWPSRVSPSRTNGQTITVNSTCTQF